MTASGALPGRWDGLIVVCAGTPWTSHPMPEHHIARQLAGRRPILFVDPPVSLVTAWRDPAIREAMREPRLRLVAPGLARLTPLVQPGMRRPGSIRLTEPLTRLHIRRALRALGARAASRVLASDLVLFEPRAPERRVLYATDDFGAGAQLFGTSQRTLARNLERMRKGAERVIAVSPALADAWRARGCDVVLIPNGCDAEQFAHTDEAPDPDDVRLPSPIAGFTGTINDRIDLACLEAVADAGHSLLLVGPVSRVSDPARLERLFARPNVQWVGPRPFERMPSYLKRIDVGLTPYADTPFNQASMPLKTIEYLAAGRPAVATDLAGARFLATDLVVLASSPRAFAEATGRLLREPRDPARVAARRAFAAGHSWRVRAEQFLAALDLPS
jgi:teichuronic acid biosynthesis glycosyltransferase TuaH